MAIGVCVKKRDYAHEKPQKSAVGCMGNLEKGIPYSKCKQTYEVCKPGKGALFLRLAFVAISFFADSIEYFIHFGPQR